LINFPVSSTGAEIKKEEQKTHSGNRTNKDKYSGVAQLVEQLTVNQLVAGSSPAAGANKNNLTLWGYFLLPLGRVRTFYSACPTVYLRFQHKYNLTKAIFISLSHFQHDVIIIIMTLLYSNLQNKEV
jgi:hypothetical protein